MKTWNEDIDAGVDGVLPSGTAEGEFGLLMTREDGARMFLYGLTEEERQGVAGLYQEDVPVAVQWDGSSWIES